MFRNYRRVFELILLLLICTLLLIPIVLIIFFSLQTFESIIYTNWNGWTMSNFKVVMDGFLPAMLFTSMIIFFSSIFTLSLSISAAFAMSQLEFKFKRLLSLFILLPICIPGSAIIASEYKLITSLGMASGTMSFVLGLSLPFAYSYLSYAILKSGYDNMPKTLKDKAYTDGINSVDYFFTTLGMVKNEMTWVILITCISTWNSYLYPRIILMGTDIRVITLWLYDVSIDAVDLVVHPELQAAASIIASIPLVTFFVIFRKRLINVVSNV